MMRGLIIGRFQPFHRGHLQLIREILKESGEVVIAVTSAQFNFLEKDPFTAGERIVMIHEALREAKLDLAKCYIVPVVNDENNARWVAHLRSFVPQFDVVYTGNPYVGLLMRREGVRVKQVKFYDKEKYNATRIRQLILRREDWESLVPKAVARIIKEINGVERMKVIAQSDSKPQEW
jgi:nicotinamide-nucleotide adenylyltransferase